jgi:dTDP-4-dehydrorhamnose 3,5-epimerase-like enzyme
MSLIKFVDLPSMCDKRGSLVSIEANKHIPFDVKRVYYIYGTKQGESRGFHAHKNLQQLAVCVAGRCYMFIDDGINKESVCLDSPSRGLLIGNNVWREMRDFSDNCVLLVLASEHYDESDYIRDYSEFKRRSSNDFKI